jgi:hypothetical protein
MEQELGAEKTPSIEAVCNAVTRQFGNVFGVQILWLESLESLLKTRGEAEVVPTLSPQEQNRGDKDGAHNLGDNPPNHETPARGI